MLNSEEYFITFDGDEANTYKADYNTKNYTVSQLIEICKSWSKEDEDGTVYYLYNHETDEYIYS